MPSFFLAGRALAVAALVALAACGGGSDSPPPASPSGDPGNGAGANFSAVGTSDGTVSLVWSAPAGDGRYAIERRTGDGAYAPVATVSASARGFVDHGLAASTAYDYRLVPTTAGASPIATATATTSDETAIVTGAGTPIGQPVQTQFTGEGTRTVSPDGLIAFDLPAGSIPVGADITTQATQNTAPDGRGEALRVRLSAVPTQAIALRVRYEDADAVLADGLRIAVHRGDGTWWSLPLSGIDKTTRTLTATLPTELLASAQREGAQSAAHPHGPGDVSLEFTVVRYLAVRLSPREASVRVDRTLELVPHARVRGYDVSINVCEDIDATREACIITPIMQTREMPLLNQKPGYSRGWYVFLVRGGDATYGTVVPNGNVGATYTAPSEVPDPRTAIVTFQSTHNATGRTVLLSSAVTITDGNWAGTLTAVDGPSDTGTSIVAHGDVTWHLDLEASTTSTLVYRAEGTISATVTDDDCTVSVTPSVMPVTSDPAFSRLEVDITTTPNRYRLRLVTFWTATLFAVCPRASATHTGLAGWGWEGEGVLENEGHTITMQPVPGMIRQGWSFSN